MAPLENRTGDPTLNTLGEMAADWIARDLVLTGEFDVVDERTAVATRSVVERIPRVLRPGDLPIALAHETGAGRVVAGSIYRVADSLRIETRVIDVASGRVLRVPDPAMGLARAPSELVESLARRVVAGLAAAADATVIGADSQQPPSYVAFKEASRGWESWFRGDLDGFFAHTKRATDLDSTFMTPLLLQAFALTQNSLWAEAAPVIDRLERHRDRLSEGERWALDAFRADLDGDLLRHLGATQEVLRRFPASAEVPLLVCRAALRLNRPRDALDALARTDPRRGVNLVSPHYWINRSAALHQLGDYGGAREAARRCVRQFPTSVMARRVLVTALSALGRVGDLEGVLRQSRPNLGLSRYTMTSPSYAPDWNLLLAIRELRAHGHAAEAGRLAARVRRGAPPGDVDTARAIARYVYGALEYEVGHLEDARSVFTRLVAEDSADVRSRAYLGAIAARLGDRERAQQVAATLGSRRDPYLLGAHTFGRARIASLLGDRVGAVRLLTTAITEGQTYDDETTTHEVLHGHPDFASLRDYPPFQRLIAPQREPALGRLGPARGSPPAGAAHGIL